MSLASTMPAAVLLLLATGAVSADELKGLTVTKTADANIVTFEFIPDAAKATIKGSLMYPEGIAPYRVVILVHGRSGSGARMVANSGATLRERGYASIGVDLPFPANLAEKGGDPEETQRRLAACLEILEHDNRIDAGKIFIYGIADGAEAALRLSMQSDKVKAAAITGYGLTPESPIRGDFGRIKAPVLLLHGDKDQVVAIESVRKLKEAIEKAGKPVELKVFENRGTELPMIRREEVLDAVVAFFGKHPG